MTPPMSSLAPDVRHEFEMSNEPELFPMDDPGYGQEDDHIDTLGSLEVDVDQAQVCPKGQSCCAALTL